MGTRIKNPATSLPNVLSGVGQLVKGVRSTGLPETTGELVAMRISQINGCAACLHGHLQAARKLGETDERLATVAAWWDTPLFTEPERAGLALAEAMTRIADHTGEAVSDQVWNEAARHYDEQQLAALVLLIGLTNLFNRINTAVGEQAGNASWA